MDMDEAALIVAGRIQEGLAGNSQREDIIRERISLMRSAAARELDVGCLGLIALAEQQLLNAVPADPLAVIAKMLQWPVAPVYDDDGNLLGARRVPKLGKEPPKPKAPHRIGF